MHVMKTGGGFGRRGVLDADIIVEAVAAARAIGWRAPVKVQWTREDDMKGGKYRPAFVHAVKAGLDSDGRLVAWEQHVVGQSLLKGTPFEAFMKDGIDPTSVEGAWNVPYAIPNRTVGLTTTEVGVPVLWWRSVGSTHTAYVVETFLDELAEAAGTDPLDFRLALLPPRHANVLRLAAEKAGWGTPAPDARARGLALAEASTQSSHRWPRSASARGASRYTRWSAPSTAAYRSTPTTSGPRWRAASASASGDPRRGADPHGGRGRPGELRHLHAAAHRRHAGGRGAHRAFDRAAYRRRRAGRAADRPGGRERDRRRDRQAHPRAADRQGDAGLTAGRDALTGGRLRPFGGHVM